MARTTGHPTFARGPGAENARTLAESAQRRRSVILAGHTGDRDVALAGLEDESPEVRASALRALTRLGQLDTAALVAGLRDADAQVRRTAAELAATWRDRSGDDADAGDGAVELLPLLHDPVAEVVETTAWACGERVPPLVTRVEPGVVTALITLATSHDDPLVREAAVAALGSIGDIEGLAAILAATGDKATVRRRAVIALAPFEGPEVDAALERALEDRDWQVRQAAEDLLA